MIFDATQYEDDSPQFKKIVEGDYKVAIAETRMSVKDANRTSFMVKVEVVEGECKGSWLWSWMHLKNPSDKAVEIAKKNLSSFCRAQGIKQIDDFSLDHAEWAESWKDQIINIHVTAKDAAQDYPSISWVINSKPEKKEAPKQENSYNDEIPF